MYGSTDITKAADLMFSRITDPVLTVPFTTTGHTEEIRTLTQGKKATALTNLSFISCSNWLQGSHRARLSKRKKFLNGNNKYTLYDCPWVRKDFRGSNRKDSDNWIFRLPVEEG